MRKLEREPQEVRHTKSSAVLPMRAGFSGDTDIPPDWNSVSSKKGFVDKGLSRRPLKAGETGLDGDTVRFLKGLLEPRLTVSRGEGWRSVESGQMVLVLSLCRPWRVRHQGPKEGTGRGSRRT